MGICASLMSFSAFFYSREECVLVEYIDTVISVGFETEGVVQALSQCRGGGPRVLTPLLLH